MNAEEQIRDALKSIMSAGEANACRIFKGYDAGTGATGWHYQRFGQSATFARSSLSEAMEFIASIKEEREEIG